MAASSSGGSETRGAGPHGEATVRREPAAALRAHVQSYEAYHQVNDGPVREIHLPSGDVPLIIGFGDPLVSVTSPHPSEAGRAHQTFVAGLYESASVTDAGRIAHGIQVNFTPLGAYQFLGQPMHELTNRVVDLDDVLGAEAARLVALLRCEQRWEACFGILDDAIARRLARSQAPSEGVAWAWRRIVETHGRTAIASLTTELGWSRKQTVARFREQVGVAPKTLARILRFQHAVRLIEQGEDGSWTQVALRAGYYDQAHLIRDFRAFAASTPGAYVARRRAERAAGRR